MGMVEPVVSVQLWVDVIATSGSFPRIVENNQKNKQDLIPIDTRGKSDDG